MTSYDPHGERVYEYTGVRLAANVAMGAIASATAMIAATGSLVPAIVVGAFGGGITCLLTHRIPKIQPR
jgi:hypothetical protein